MIKLPIFLLWERKIGCGRIGKWGIIGYTKYKEHADQWIESHGKISRKVEEVEPISIGILNGILRSNG